MLQRWAIPLSLSVAVHALLLWWLAAPSSQPGASVQVLQVQVAMGRASAPTSKDAPARTEPADPVASKTAPDRQVSESPSQPAQAVTAPETDERRDAIAAGQIAGEPDPQWQQQLREHLQSRMRYPRGARMRRQQGVAELMFELDRHACFPLEALDRDVVRVAGVAA